MRADASWECHVALAWCSMKTQRLWPRTDLVAAVLVEDDQEDGHDDDDADHDDGVEDGIQEATAHRGRVFSEGGVNPAAEVRWAVRSGGVRDFGGDRVHEGGGPTAAGRSSLSRS